MSSQQEQHQKPYHTVIPALLTNVIVLGVFWVSSMYGNPAAQPLPKGVTTMKPALIKSDTNKMSYTPGEKMIAKERIQSKTSKQHLNEKSSG